MTPAPFDARDGAKILIKDAKAGVGAVGASVGLNNTQENGQGSLERGRQPQRLQQEDTDGAREFEVRGLFVERIEIP